jgi:hypothetical protein
MSTDALGRNDFIAVFFASITVKVDFEVAGGEMLEISEALGELKCYAFPLVASGPRHENGSSWVGEPGGQFQLFRELRLSSANYFNGKIVIGL